MDKTQSAIFVLAWLAALPNCSSTDVAAPHEKSDAAESTPTCESGGSDAGACNACVRQGLLASSASGDVCSYLGIPYGKPPVGDLRFAAPKPAEGWAGVRDATNFASACIQAGGLDITGGATTDEDCLYLNVWTSTVPDKPLPVMVFIYGGGYTTGATNTYVGSALAEKGPAVVVSMNYRLGALGFFGHPDLDKERSNEPSGSDAIRDQQLALEWVHDNIASFHGNPANVTLFGESAGSAAIGVHVASPGSRGLVTRFIMESGVSTHGVASGIEPVTRDAKYALSGQLAADLCPGESDVIGCLRKLPAADIVKWSAPAPADAGASGAFTLRWVPTVEGTGGVLPDSPDALMQSGKFNPGEILVGTNKYEYGFFQLVGIGAKAATLAEMRTRVQAQFGDKVDSIMAIYAPDSSVDPSEAYTTLMTDVMFRCQTRHFARLAASQGRKVYLYSFEQGTAFHSEELIYVFGQGNFALALNSTPVPALVDAVQSYWLDFAKSGDPNGSGPARWPEYDETGDKNITLVDPPTATSGLQKSGCDYWDAYLESQ